MLIGLHGKKQAGKDTVYARIAMLYGRHADVERLSFADLLYESAAAALGVGVGFLQQNKSNPAVGVQIVDYERNVRGHFAPIRQVLQRYGTEAHRHIFGDNFWVDQIKPRLCQHAGKIVVVTDVRFGNEAQAVADAGGTVVHVVGPVDVEAAGDGHASEEALPHHLVDYRLGNSSRDDDFRQLDRNVGDLMELMFRAERRPFGRVVR